MKEIRILSGSPCNTPREKTPCGEEIPLPLFTKPFRPYFSKERQLSLKLYAENVGGKLLFYLYEDTTFAIRAYRVIVTIDTIEADDFILMLNQETKIKINKIFRNFAIGNYYDAELSDDESE